MPGRIKVASADVIEFAAAHAISLAGVAGTGPGGQVTMDDVKAARPAPYVTPLVAKLAAEHGVDLHNVEGTGAGGRIRKDDVLKAAGLLPTAPTAADPRAINGPDHLDPELRSLITASKAAGDHARRQSTQARGPAWALNPRVDHVRAEATAGRGGMPTAPAPTLFASGDLPAFTASGIAPSALLDVPAAARHAMAAAPTPAAAYEIATTCTDADAATTAAMFYGDHPGNADYADRVKQWQLNSLSDEQLYESLMPGAQAERTRREAALPVGLPPDDETAIAAHLRRT